ncbi:MAG: choice-of-anchor D domain-containing protein [Pseudomonadota bacterium]
MQEAKLAPSVTGFAEFGWSVSLDGERAMVAAPLLSTNGLVYVFDRDPGTGQWPASALLRPSDPGSGRFANSISLDGDRALVGAPFNAANGTFSGAAYVFERDSSTGVWSQSVQLFSDDIAMGDIFGRSVSLSGDRALIGADGAGAAYIFERNPMTGIWSQTAKLTATDANSGDRFGWSVSLSGDRALVGAYDSISIGNTGAAYVFDRDTGSGLWPQSAKLVATDAGSADRFGWSVSLSGDRALVGAYLDDDAGDRSGSAYVFDHDAGMWSQTDKLTANDAAANDEFGYSVSLLDDRALVGAPNNDFRRGAAYLFGRDPATGLWPQNAKLVAADAEIGDNFGWSVSVSEARALIGAVGDSDNTGSAYILTLPTFNIGGTISGLSGGGLVLQNNGGDDLPIAADGVFTFPGLLADGQAYDVTVLSQPTDPSQTCSVSNGSGTLAGADVTDVLVTCVTEQYTVGGTVTGLASGNSVVVSNNGGDAQTVDAANPSFSFSPQDDGTGFNVTVQIQPSGPSQTCTVTDGTGTVSGGNVTNVQVNCVMDQFTVGGNVSDLAGSGLVLQNNGADDLAITANEPFAFLTALDDGSSYTVTVQTQPSEPDQICTLSNGSGVLGGSNVTNVEVQCISVSGINILPDVLDFGDQALGVPTDPQMAVVESLGPAELVLGSITVAGPHADDFQITLDSCTDTTLPVDDACGIDVVFTPSTAGVRQAWINIPSNAPSSPDRVDVMGTNDVLFRDGFELESDGTAD